MDLNTLTIRPASVSELPVAAEFWIAMFEEVGILHDADLDVDWRKRFVDYFARRIETGEVRYLLALDGKDIVGTAGALFADGYPFEVSHIRRGYIFGVRVAPTHRKAGLAERLTRETIAFLKDAKCTKIRLHASPFGRAIYERIGFVPTNEMELPPSLL